MAVTISGDTGISAVQAGAVESGDLAAGAIGSGDLPAGSVIQVAHKVTDFEVSFTNTSFFDTGFFISITPKSENSKILVTLSGGRIRLNGSSGSSDAHLIIKRNATTAIDDSNNIMRVGTLDDDEIPISYAALDEDHGTTNPITYDVFALSTDGSPVDLNNGGVHCFSITAMEIAG